MHEVTIDMRRQGGINPKDLPYIDWERVENPGLGEGHGEKKVVQRTVLFDPKGSPFVWLDQNWVTYTIQKGWKVVDYGNFDKVKRHDGTPHEQLEEVRALIEGRADMHREMETMRAENEALKAERASLIAERNALSAPAVEGDFRTTEEKDAGIVSVVLDNEVPTGHTAAETTSVATSDAPAVPAAAPAAGKGKSGK